MKKLILLSFVLLTALTTWADADIQSGSMLSLKNSDVRVLVVWDYSKMLIEDQKPDAFLKEKGPEWVRDYPAEVAAGESAFATQFNKKDKKYALITDDEDAAQYKMVFHVNNFHYGSTGAAIVFGGWARGASIEGVAEIIDMATKTVVCKVAFDCAGKSAYSNEERRVLAYKDLAEDMAKLVSKAK